MRKPSVLFLEFIKWARRSPPNGLAPTNRFSCQDPRLRAKDGVVLDLSMVRYPDLASYDDALANRTTAGDTGLRRQYRMLADANVVGHLNQVIDFYSACDRGDVERTSINRRVRTDFHVVADLNAPDLREFPVTALTEDVAESVAAYDCAGMDFDAVEALQSMLERTRAERVFMLNGSFFAESIMAALANTVVAAVGPVVAETLRRHGIEARVMPEESFFLKPLTSVLEDALGAKQ